MRGYCTWAGKNDLYMSYWWYNGHDEYHCYDDCLHRTLLCYDGGWLLGWRHQLLARLLSSLLLPIMMMMTWWTMMSYYWWWYDTYFIEGIINGCSPAATFNNDCHCYINTTHNNDHMNTLVLVTTMIYDNNDNNKQLVCFMVTGRNRLKIIISMHHMI